MSRTVSADPIQKFKFRLTIPGLPSGIGFQKVSGLSEEVGVAEYEEGGYDYAHKLPGRAKVGEVTAERGEYADVSLHELLKETLTNPSLLEGFCHLSELVWVRTKATHISSSEEQSLRALRVFPDLVLSRM